MYTQTIASHGSVVEGKKLNVFSLSGYKRQNMIDGEKLSAWPTTQKNYEYIIFNTHKNSFKRNVKDLKWKQNKKNRNW